MIVCIAEKPSVAKEIADAVTSRTNDESGVAEAVKKVIPQHMLDARLKKFAIKL